MRLNVHEILLTDRDIWRSAREAIPEQAALLIELSSDGISGFGEASAFMTDRYNSDLSAMHDSLRDASGILQTLPGDDPEGTWDALTPALTRSPFVLAGLDVAAHDLAARLAGIPLWQHLGGQPPSNLRSSYSIGLDSPDVMIRKLRERPGWSAYKVKLADPGDLHVLQSLREHTHAPFYVDGNCGWELADTLAALDRMTELGVALLEQPFPRERWEDARVLKENSVIPVLADESITGPGDLDACARAFDGINLKLMKAGGITPALGMLRRARALGLSTMVGCMPESSAGVSATAHLGTYADYMDIDSIALLSVDTGTGVRLDCQGLVSIPDAPGSGFVPDRTSPAFTVRCEVSRFPDETTREIMGFRDGKPVAKAGLRRDSSQEQVGTGKSLELTGPEPYAGLAPKASPDELAALLRVAITAALSDGADVVWTRGDGPDLASKSAAGFTPLNDGGTAADPLLVWMPKPHLESTSK